MNNPPPPSQSIQPINSVQSAEAESRSFGKRSERRFDFGTVVSKPGRRHKHVYTFTNHSSKDVKLTRAVNRKSCCGNVAFQAKTLRPGEQGTIEITLRTDQSLGPLSHYATVETDEVGTKPLEFWTFSRVLPRVGLEPLDESSVVRLRPGTLKRLEFQAIANDTVEDRPLALDDASVAGTLPIVWLGPAREKSLDGSIVERSRAFSIELKAGAEPGRKSEEIQLLDGGVVLSRRPVPWEISPALRVSPDGLVVSASEGACERTLFVRSETDDSFEIKSLTCDLAGVSAEASPKVRAKVHSVRLKIAPDSRNIGKVARLTIATDHPSQPIAKATVFISGTTVSSTEAAP